MITRAGPVAEVSSNGDVDLESPRCTDAGNARRFVLDHGPNVRYVATWGAWMIWDGRCWAKDQTGAIVERAKKTVAAIFAEAAYAEDPAARRELAKHALRSEGEPSLRRMLQLAQSDPRVAMVPAQFDADPWILNTPSGVVDLRTGTLRPATREDYCTLLTAAPFDPEARLEIFDAFLTRVLPDEDVRAFVQRWAGYCLTGDTSEEKFVLGHGATSSGKSTLLSAMRSAWGDYAAVADFTSFTEARGDGPKEDLARLAGKRLVISIEVKDGTRLAEGLVKWLTGGDVIAARRLYERTFEFAPQFKLLLAANSRPRARDDDDAMWRRVLEVPFTQSLPEAERDSKVKATLCDPSQAGAAILAWAGWGLLAWRRVGLAIPDAVRGATTAYRAAMDPLAGFVKDVCVIEKAAWVSAHDLRNAYEGWAKTEGIRHPLAGRAFGDRLRAHGCTPKRMGPDRERGWLGIRLRGLLDAEEAEA